jgi:hypothetical protein
VVEVVVLDLILQEHKALVVQVEQVEVEQVEMLHCQKLL